MTQLFPPTRAAGLQKLTAFAPRAGRDYAAGRNTDNGPDGHAHVSRLSPYLRYRLIAEREVVQAVLTKHSLPTAEKYVQEVLWRTYWKGWLEMRPAVWDRFVDERDRARDSVPDADALAAAESGATGIEGFDHWARELVETGHLHNHARMWFASIWIFTLKLPWTLGADFFLRHLIDADAASNTLSWRWVAGLQTVGKTYLATTDNIARFTGGRFAPKRLAAEAVALIEQPLAGPSPLPEVAGHDPHALSLLLVTPEDMSPETLLREGQKIGAVSVLADANLCWGDKAARFVSGAVDDAVARLGTRYRCPANLLPKLDADALIAAAEAAEVHQIVTPYSPVGPVASTLRDVAPELAKAGITLSQIRRPWDAHFWPHANKGFFPFKEKIAAGLAAQGIVQR